MSSRLFKKPRDKKPKGHFYRRCVQKLRVRQRQDKIYQALLVLNIGPSSILNGQVGPITLLLTSSVARGSVPRYSSAATLCYLQPKNKLQAGSGDMRKVGQPRECLIVWQPSDLPANTSLQARRCDFALSKPDLTSLQSKQSKYSLFDCSI